MRRNEPRNRADRRAAARKTARVAGAVLTASNATGAAIAAGAALVITGGPAGASPMTFTVTNTSDSGPGSLRQAIVDSNGNNPGPGAHNTISFLPSVTGTITLASELIVQDAVTINGPGAGVLSVSGNNASRVFYLYGLGASFDVTISGLTITKGKVTSGGGAGILDKKERLHLLNSVVTGNQATTGSAAGIDVFYSGSLDMQNTTVSGNTASRSGGGIGVFYSSFSITGSTITGNMVTNSTNNGGGLVADNAGTGTIVDTTISGNTARRGGGLGVFYSSSLTVRNTTISGNHATAGRGPGTGVGGGVDAASVGKVKFFNSTISGNTATNSAGGFFLYNVPHFYLVQSTVTANTGAGVNGQAVTGQHTQALDPVPPNAGAAHPPLHPHQRPAVHTAAATAVNLVGTILAGNSGSMDLTNAGTVTSDHSLLGAKDAGTTVTDLGGTITGVSPQLGPLANNGGPTQTHALLTGSPAIDAGPLTVPSFPGNQFDQRGAGFARVSNGRVDIGAFELQVQAIVVTPRFTG